MKNLETEITNEAIKTFSGGEFYTNMPKEEYDALWYKWAEHWFKIANNYADKFQNEGLIETEKYVRGWIEYNRTIFNCGP